MKAMNRMRYLVWAFCFVASPSVLAQQTASISGQVFDESGQPVAGASVCLVASGIPTDAHLSAKTDKAGRFAMQPMEAVRSVYFTVAAWKPGFGVGHIRKQTQEQYSDTGAIPRAKDISIELPDAKPVTFTIVDVNGKPLSNTPVMARAMSVEDGTTIFYSGRKRGLGILERKTDASGAVTIDYLAANTLASLTIQSEQWGSQMVNVSARQDDGELTLKLMPSTLVRMVLGTSDKSVQLGGRKISVNSRLDGQKEYQAGQATLRVGYGIRQFVTNDDGVAEGRVLSGTADFYLEPRDGDTFFADGHARGIKLLPGEEHEQRFEFKPGVRVYGRVVDTDGMPVAGVKVQMAGTKSLTDDRGKYESFVSATTQTYFRVLSVPPGYAMPYSTFGSSIQQNELEGKSEFERPDTIIEVASEFAGTVVDDNGDAVEAATVLAAWRATDPSGSTFTRKSLKVESDSDGKFAFTQIPREASVRLTAQTREQASAAQIVVNDENADVKLKVTDDGMMKLTGTVRSMDGGIVEDAEVRVSRAMLVADGGSYGERTVDFGGMDFFTVSTDGTFTAPQMLPRSGKYALKIGARGYLTKQTKFLEAGESGDLDVGETQLVAARSTQGVVVDADGSPLAGVAVSAYSSEKDRGGESKKTTVKTDSEGQFLLDGIHPQAAIALLEMEGYRPKGLPILKEKSSTVNLYLVDETIPVDHRIAASKFDDTTRHPRQGSCSKRFSRNAAARTISTKKLPA